MPIEIEAKIKVKDFTAVRERLQAAGAAPAGAVLESNVFLDTNDHRLRTADEGLRLRTLSKTNGETDGQITFKGPRQQGALKSRDEIQVRVDDAAAALSILEALSFERVMTFEKRRETWKLGGCHVELDELPHLGTFVEIEGPSEKAVMAVRDQLGLKDQALIRSSYIALLSAHLEEHGKQSRNIKFA